MLSWPYFKKTEFLEPAKILFLHSGFYLSVYTFWVKALTLNTWLL